MFSICQCPHCRGSLLLESIADITRRQRCVHCTAIFEISEVAGQCVAAPPMAVAADAPVEVATGMVTTTSTACAVPAVETHAEHAWSDESAAGEGAVALQGVGAGAVEHHGTNGSYPTMDGSPNDAWYASLSAAEGSSTLASDFDDPESARPYHEEPEYNSHAIGPVESVIDATGSLTPEAAAEVLKAYEDIVEYEDELDEDVELGKPTAWDETSAATGFAPPVQEPAHEALREQDGWGSYTEQGETAFETEGEGYGLAAEGAAIAEPSEAYRSPPPRRRKKKNSIMPMVVMMTGIVLGGAVGILIADVALIWLRGRPADFLGIYDKLPGFMVPSSGSSAPDTMPTTVPLSRPQRPGPPKRKSLADLANEPDPVTVPSNSAPAPK
ncbi:MAG: hypothetical protein JSS27_16800 [Planctomycetes bacterium]|nr:hypothetical protein [Planctomycetota bacterium]